MKELAHMFNTNAKVALVLQQISVEIEARADRDTEHMMRCTEDIMDEVERSQARTGASAVFLDLTPRSKDGRRFRMLVTMCVDDDPVPWEGSNGNV